MTGRDYSALSMLDLFRIEAETQTQAMIASLIEIERDPTAAAQLEACMRAAHSIKGAARIVDLAPGVEIAHVMEDIMVAAQQGRIMLYQPEIDLLLRGVDLLLAIARPAADNSPAVDIDTFLTPARQVMAALGRPRDPGPPVEDMVAPLIDMGAEDQAAHGEVLTPTDVADRRAVDPMLRLSAQSLNRLLGLASESLIETRRLRPFADRLLRLKRQNARSAEALRHYRDALPHASLDERTRALLVEAEEQARAGEQSLLQCLGEIEAIDQRATGLSQRLYDEALACRMRPFEDGMGRFGRLVRDLARDLGKQARLEIVGTSTSVDRDILEQLDAPLGHLLRNAVDHGIEMPDERLLVGKPAEAVIRIEARHNAGLLHVSVVDDGRGIDLAALRSAIVRRGFTDEPTAARLTDAELLEFLFLPGFSMKGSVTDVSGRGVGLDAVQAMARQVRGVVRASVRQGGGMEFQLQLPLTLSVVRALLVDIDSEAYAFPLAAVVRALQLPRDRVEVIEGRQHFPFEGEQIGLVMAHQLFDSAEPDLQGESVAIVVVRDAHNSYAVVVDRFIGERELVVQPLDMRLGKIPDIEAAALAEDGSPILVIDVADLIRSIEKLTALGRLRHLRHDAREVVGQRRKRVLVVDDSLTVREVERKLLAQHGYDVEVSVDGMDGWNAVRGGQFDLVVTDVDMPRMDGIELVTLIRQDHRLAATPIMIVSYKDREEDRRRGLEAGADYYLAKSSFHDTAMLQAVIDLIGEADS
jgi:two-component system sensor histidine kinase and response regulator WspE